MSAHNDDADHLEISAYHFGEHCPKGRGASWIYVCSQPDDRILDLLTKLSGNPELVYCASCFERNVNGEQAVIVYFQFRFLKSYNSIYYRYKFGRGVLLRKPPKKILPFVIVNWMRGPFQLGLVRKLSNPTFQFVRPGKSDHKLKGEGADEPEEESNAGSSEESLIESVPVDYRVLIKEVISEVVASGVALQPAGSR